MFQKRMKKQNSELRNQHKNNKGIFSGKLYERRRILTDVFENFSKKKPPCLQCVLTALEMGRFSFCYIFLQIVSTLAPEQSGTTHIYYVCLLCYHFFKKKSIKNWNICLLFVQFNNLCFL